MRTKFIYSFIHNNFLSTYCIPAPDIGTEYHSEQDRYIPGLKERTLLGRGNTPLISKPMDIIYNIFISVIEGIEQSKGRECDERGSVLDMLLKQVPLRR